MTMTKAYLMKCLNIASAVYSEAIYVLPDFKVLGFFDDRHTGVQFCLGEFEKKLVVCFRGSDEMADWSADFKFWKKRVTYEGSNNDIYVHSGIYNSFQTARSEILYAISKYIGKYKNVLVIGHSYGGGLALFCGLDIKEIFDSLDVEVITFGCPRIGNKEFKKYYEKVVLNTTRVENSNDIVTKVPFAMWDYRHCGKKIHIGYARILFIYSRRQHSCKSYAVNLLKINTE